MKANVRVEVTLADGQKIVDEFEATDFESNMVCASETHITEDMFPSVETRKRPEQRYQLRAWNYPGAWDDFPGDVNCSDAELQVIGIRAIRARRESNYTGQPMPDSVGVIDFSVDAAAEIASTAQARSERRRLEAELDRLHVEIEMAKAELEVKPHA